MQSLVQQNMRGSALEVGDTFVTFHVPDDEKLLDGNGDNTVAHVVVYDNRRAAPQRARREERCSR